MTVSLLLWLALALIIFWCVGVYNRLMRIRARGRDALGSVDKHLRLHQAMVQMHLSSEGGVADGAIPDGWRALTVALDVLDSAAKAAKLEPLSKPAMFALQTAYLSVQSVWAALLAEPDDLAGSQIPGTLQADWEEASAKVQIARGGLNQIVDIYNEALHQFPASLVAKSMGFQEAGIF
jgi:LemA protein